MLTVNVSTSFLPVASIGLIGIFAGVFLQDKGNCYTLYEHVDVRHEMFME
jgi:hypothetical protein